MTPQQFRLLADLVPDAVLLLSHEGIVLAANSAALRLFASPDPRGRNLSDLIPASPEAHSQFLQKCRTEVLAGVPLDSENDGNSLVGQHWTGTRLPEQEGEDHSGQILLRSTSSAASQSQVNELNLQIEKLNDEIQKRRQAEGEAREWGELLRVTLGSIGDAVIATDSHGQITFMNPIAEQITGWSSSEARNQALEEVFHIINEQSRSRVENPVTKALREGQVVGLANHTILIARDGKEHPIDDSAAPIRDQSGVIVGAVLVFRDVAERREEERAKRRLAAIIEDSDDAIISKNLDGIVTSWNRAAERIYGYTADEIIGQSFSVLLPEDRKEESLITLQRIGRGERIEQFETQRITKDGRLIDLTVSYSPLLDQSGELTGISVIAHDLTEQKRAEQIARENRSRLESTLAAVEVGTWEYDVVQNRVRADRNLARMYNVTLEDAEGGPLESYLKAIHPEDRPTVIEEISQALMSQKDINTEYRLLTPDGNIRWVAARGRVVRDASGRAIRLPGVLIDVTERKAAEERERLLADEAAKANAQFRAIFEQGTMFASILGLDGTLIEPNHLSLEASRSTREQVVGKPFWDGPWWQDDPSLQKEVRAQCESAAKGTSSRKELAYYQVGGTRRIMDSNIVPIRDSNGKIVFLAHTGNDITDRLNAVKALQESEGRHRFLSHLSQAVQPLTEPSEILAVTSMLLTEHLEVNRCAYAEVENELVFVISGDYSQEVPSIAGRWPIADFGHECVQCMADNTPYLVNDVKTDERIRPDDLSAYHAAAIAAVIWVPLHQNGKLAAAMAVHQSTPRTWTSAEVELVTTVVSRTWEALERARAAQAERRLHAEVAAEQSRLEDIFRFAPSFMAVFHGPDHHFERVNDRYAILFGHRELIGRPVREAIPELQGQQVVEYLDQVYRSGEPYIANDARVLIRLPPDQRLQRRILDFVYQPIRDATGDVTGILVQGVDITERREAESRLMRVTTESERRRRLYNAILSSTPDLVCVFDLQHRFTYANEALLAVWGKTWDEAIGRTCLELGFEPWHAKMHDDEIETVRTTRQPIRGEVPFTGTSGRHIYDYIFVPVIGDDGEVEAIAGTTRDVTERQALEQELREASQRKDEFLAMLAHELRNPLAPVRTGLELLSLSGVEHESIHVMRNQIDHLARLVDDLLDVSRITRGKIHLRREAVDLILVAQRAIENIRPAMAARRHQMHVSMPATPVWVYADPVRMAQVLSNLLQNAVKYTDPEGQISLSLVTIDQNVVVTVTDNGTGIDAQLLPHIFDLFIQADRSLERSEGGLGIGLTLVKSLTEMHEGSVEAFSDGSGQGSRFVLTLPLLKHSPGPPANRQFIPSTKALRILVVDDNVGTTVIQSKLLAKLGSYEIRTAHDGPQAICVAREMLPDLIFLDIGLPGMSGYDVARQLRSDPEFANTLIVASTGYGTDDDRIRSREAGFDFHVVKPPSLEILREVLSHPKLR